MKVPVGDRTIPFHKAGILKSGHKAWINHLYREGGHYRGEGGAEFQKVMDGVTHNTGRAPILTLGRLHIGATCQIQLFAVDERAGHVKNHAMQFSGDRGNQSESFAVGSRSFVTGAFTADAPTQTIKVQGESWVINGHVLTALSLGPNAKTIEKIEARKATARSWQRHEAPSPVWVVAPRTENGKGNEFYLGCQDNSVYAISADGKVEWSFDTGGLPSRIINADLDNDGRNEVIVASHDTQGTIYLLSNKGEPLRSYAHGAPFPGIAVVDGKTCQASFLGPRFSGSIYPLFYPPSALDSARGQRIGQTGKLPLRESRRPLERAVVEIAPYWEDATSGGLYSPDIELL